MDLSQPLARALAWFPPDTWCAGIELRPLSLLSRHVLRLIGSPLMTDPADGEAATLSEEEERAALGVYAWLHSVQTPLDTVGLCLWTGDWHVAADTGASLDAAQVGHFRALLWRQRQLVRAAGVRIVPKPDDHKASSRIPAEVEGPALIAQQLCAVSQVTGQSLRQVGWELPLAQALQVWHAALWEGGYWTARERVMVAPSRFAAFDPLSGLGQVDAAPSA